MSEKALLQAESYTVKEQIERETDDAATGTNEQQKEADGVRIEGLAIPFNKRSRNGVVYETESLKEAAETLIGCSILFNHDDNEPLGHVKNVEVTDEGIRYEGDLNPERRETESLKRGDIPNVSIQAMIEESESSQSDVAVTEFLELSAVTVPGYPSTTVNAEGVMVESFVGEENSMEQAKYEYKTGDWVQWEFADGTAKGIVRDRENEPGEELSVDGGSRQATEEEPVYKMEEWDDEEEELTNNVVKSQSELTEVDDPRTETVTEQPDEITYEFEPIPKLVLYDNEADARQRANDLGVEGIHQHEVDDQQFWMAGQTHGQWRQLVGVQESVDTNKEDTSEEPFAGYDDFDACVADNQGKEDPEAYCAAIKRKTEKAKEIKQVHEALSNVDLTPPERVKNAAQAALDWEEENPDRQDCGTGVGDSRANSIVDETLSPEDFLGGDNTAIPDYLESHEEDVTAEGSPTDWSDKEWNDCGNRQYAKWGFYLEWFKEKEQELQEAKETILGENTLMTEQLTEQMREMEESDMMEVMEGMYEELSSSDASALMEEFTFSKNPEPVMEKVAELMGVEMSDLVDMAEAMDDEEEPEDEAGDKEDDDDEEEEEKNVESESSNKNGESQDGNNDMTDKTREELENRIEELEETIMELEETEPSKQEAANQPTKKDGDGFSVRKDIKDRLDR